ncbi:hypothetical protein [Alloactinosynnema sp. L-07]|uniref:DddA-like double-stranded DNA deaminase toxin n=1 Tax=Alloactinosynnema sp. L-07 TaxID=1653480 RepID=UPI00065F0A2C|nr:DddA-like double-stranded DNA deaminase toxin [Alloactinosynnema sp. L-07]CRK55686.1 hypothetical protein [Alloactinosynnema sp. L-07]
MSVDQWAAHMRVVLSMLDQAQHTIHAAVASLGEAAQALGTAVGGTDDRNVSHAVVVLEQTKDEIVVSYEVVGDAHQAISRYLGGLAQDEPSCGTHGDRDPGASGVVRTRQHPNVPPPVAGVSNRHGDRYPEDSLPYSDDLPPRVIRGAGNSPTIGIIEIDGRMFGEMRPTRDDVWHRDVIDRIDAIGLSRRAKRYANHVEMKAAFMVVTSKGRHGRVILNHAPCGSEPGAFEGCETFLAELLLKGNSLTVLGTDAQGNPFARIYHGKAVQ